MNRHKFANLANHATLQKGADNYLNIVSMVSDEGAEDTADFPLSTQYKYLYLMYDLKDEQAPIDRDLVNVCHEIQLTVSTHGCK